jgi:integrase
MIDLPANVTPMKDRHGKIRYRFRRRGWKASYIKGIPGSAEFFADYALVLAAGPLDPQPAQSATTPAPGTLDDLLRRMKHSPKWKKKSAATQHAQSLIYQRFMDRIDSKGRRFGARPVEAVTVGWLDKIFGGMAETPGAANNLRKRLSGLMKYACALEWRNSNPVEHTTPFHPGKGFHSWADAEIAQYRATHALGTMARLAFELALNTAARRGTLAGMSRENIVHGRLITAHSKGNNETSVLILAETRAALESLPASPIRNLITTTQGKAFSPAGFGNKFREWCDEAGLPHCSIHGLRKAMSRMLAEGGATDAEGQAVTGHKKAETFQYYRAAANRETLADRALANLSIPPNGQP